VRLSTAGFTGSGAGGADLCALPASQTSRKVKDAAADTTAAKRKLRFTRPHKVQRILFSGHFLGYFYDY
jgi:hypothetical protein